jgi:hypothetical protein
VEKVRPQFLSLRQIALGRVFSWRTRWQLSPVIVAISRLRFGLPIGGTGLLFSERPVSLPSSGLHRFDTVFENRTFRVAYELQRKEVLRLLSDKQDVENSLSTCTAPWMTVLRSIALMASLPLPKNPMASVLRCTTRRRFRSPCTRRILRLYPLSVSFAQVDADDRYLIDPRIFRRKLVPMIAKRFEQTVEIY